MNHPLPDRSPGTTSLTSAQWHAAREFYLDRIRTELPDRELSNREPVDCNRSDDTGWPVTVAQYNQAVEALSTAPWRSWLQSGVPIAGIDAEHLPSPDELGLFPLEPADLISVVVPVFNEESTITEVLRNLASVPAVAQIVVVNDASRDTTGERLELLRQRIADDYWVQRLPGGIEFVSHAVNQGKGAALRSGFPFANQPWIGIQDADKEYHPGDLMRLLATARQQQGNVIYGSRFLLPDSHSSPSWHRMGNRLITGLANVCFGLRLTDVETCYKLVETSRLQPLVSQLKEERFGIEIELTAKLARDPSVRFAECPIAYDRRTYAEGKKIGVRDGFRALWCMARYR